MSYHPLVSIVMLCWNRKSDVRESLSRIREIEYGALEVIVVDNASTDGTQAMVRGEFPQVKLIEMNANIGIAAYNVGFKAARGDYIAIIDDDSYPAPQAISRMVEQFEQDPGLGLIAFDVRNDYAEKELKDQAESTDNENAGTASYAMSFNGAGAGVRKDVFRQIGYYPGEFFLYNNEMDVSFRLLDAGYKIKSFSNIVAYHKYSPTNRASWRAPYYYTRNAFWLIWKHYPADMAVPLTLQLIKLCLFYSMEQHTTIYLKAMADAFRHSGRLSGKRKAVSREIAENLRVPWYLNFTFYR